MACTRPKIAFKNGLTENGKTKLTFKKDRRFTKEQEQLIPCGKCLSCKLSYAKEWALRIYHEASLRENNCFITLTYNDENLPQDKSVDRREVQLFLKKLRKYLTKTYGTKIVGFTDKGKERKKPKVEIMSFYCGEYGDKKSRPHYHIIILGYDFTDKIYLKTSQSGHVLWESDILTSMWKKGYSNLGQVTFESAGYVARYCLKKTKEKKEYVFVDGYDEETGEILQINERKPEFIGMSKGIGKTWHNLFKGDTDKDYLETNGFKHKIPRYYDKLREKEDPLSLEEIKENRELKAKENESEQTKKRLYSKGIVKQAQNKMLIRSYEND